MACLYLLGKCGCSFGRQFPKFQFDLQKKTAFTINYSLIYLVRQKCGWKGNCFDKRVKTLKCGWHPPDAGELALLLLILTFWKKVPLTLQSNKKNYMEIYLPMSRKFTFSQKCPLSERCCTFIFTSRYQYIRTNTILLLVCQERPQEVFLEKAILKTFTIFTGKNLCCSLFLIKLKAFRSATLLKRDSNTAVFVWILRNFQEHLFLKNICEPLLLVCFATSYNDYLNFLISYW